MLRSPGLRLMLQTPKRQRANRDADLSPRLTAGVGGGVRLRKRCAPWARDLSQLDPARPCLSS